jgi:hypothetical protein
MTLLNSRTGKGPQINNKTRILRRSRQSSKYEQFRAVRHRAGGRNAALPTRERLPQISSKVIEAGQARSPAAAMRS